MTAKTVESPLGRVAVVRETHLVPLFASPAGHLPARQQPWKGIVLERHTVHSGEIPEHEHPSLCLHLQLAGDHSFEWWQDGKSAIEPTRPGSIILIPPGTRDRLRWAGSSERLILSIENISLEQVATQLGATHPFEVKGAWSLHDSSLRVLLAEMGREAREEWPLGALYADLLALSLQTSILKNHSSNEIASSPLKGGMNLATLKRSMEFIVANLAEDIGLEEISAGMGLSPSHFAHEFRNTTGSTPYQYLLRQRLERAKHLLQTSKLPIQNVSALTGFKYPANFVRTFRQRVGTSPEAWRKEHRS
jgi:AraC family transcriptional regulator